MAPAETNRGDVVERLPRGCVIGACVVSRMRADPRRADGSHADDGAGRHRGIDQLGDHQGSWVWNPCRTTEAGGTKSAVSQIDGYVDTDRGGGRDSRVDAYLLPVLVGPALGA